MCIEYNRTPIETDTYLSLCLRPLNASLFMGAGLGVGMGLGVGVGVGVGVTLIPLKAITLAPPCATGRTPLFYFPLI